MVQGWDLYVKTAADGTYAHNWSGSGDADGTPASSHHHQLPCPGSSDDDDDDDDSVELCKELCEEMEVPQLLQCKQGCRARSADAVSAVPIETCHDRCETLYCCNDCDPCREDNCGPASD